MTKKQILTVIEAAQDDEEIKTNLCLIGAEWGTKIRNFKEVITVKLSRGTLEIADGQIVRR